MAVRKNKPGERFRSKAQIDSDRIKILQMIRRGCTQDYIAAQLKVSRQQVSYDYQMVVKNAADNRGIEVKEQVAAKLLELEEIKNEAWLAWERSKEPVYEIVEEESDRGSKTSTKRKGQTGNQAYLTVIADCIRQERAIRGLDAPKEMQVRGEVTSTNIDWNVFLNLDEKVLANMGRGTVEDKLHAILSGKPDIVSGKVPPTTVESPINPPGGSEGIQELTPTNKDEGWPEEDENE